MRDPLKKFKSRITPKQAGKPVTSIESLTKSLESLADPKIAKIQQKVLVVSQAKSVIYYGRHGQTFNPALEILKLKTPTLPDSTPDPLKNY